MFHKKLATIPRNLLLLTTNKATEGEGQDYTKQHDTSGKLLSTVEPIKIISPIASVNMAKISGDIIWIIIAIRFWVPTYPSPKPTLTLTSHLGQNIGLGEG